MKNNIATFLEKYAMGGIFSTLCFAAVAFLLAQNGIWAYIDAVFLLKSKDYFLGYIEHAQLFEMGTSMFGYDSSFAVARLLSVELADLLRSIHYTYGIVLLYVLFMVVNFYTVRILFRYIFSDRFAFIGALFFAFNPVALFFLNKPGFLFAHSSLPIIVLASVKYFFDRTSNKWLWIIYSSVGLYFFISYPRITGLYGIFIPILLLIYYKDVIRIFVHHTKDVVIFAVCHIILFLPVVFPIGMYYAQDSHYFSGVSNYAQTSEKFSSNLYDAILSKDFFNSYFLSEISDNFALTFYNGAFFQSVSLACILGLIIISLMTVSQRMHKMTRKDNVALSMIILLLVSIFVVSLARFTSLDAFKMIAYSLFPFIAGNTKWMFMIHIVTISYLISWVAFYNKRYFRLIVASVIIYCLFALYPLMDYVHNPKLQTVAWENIPQTYRDTFYGKKDYRTRAALFFPSDQVNNNLIFDWSPYPIDITFNGAYKPLVSNNTRTSSSKQAVLWEGLHATDHSLANAYLLNLEDVFIFKDIRNDEVGFDFFSKKDYVGMSATYNEKMKNEKNMIRKEDHAQFVHYLDEDYAKMDFFIYSPKSILSTELHQFFDQNAIARDRRVMLMDSTAFNRPEQLPSDGFAQDVKILSKYTVGNTTKYPIKIENWDKQKPFLMQMNQTFGMSWKIKWVDQAYFDKHTCVQDWQQFTLSNNATCLSRFGLVSIDDIKLLFAPEVKTEHHFEGNFVGNSWMIDAQDIPVELHDDKELYAVIVYEKQIYFIWILIFAGCTVVVLAILAIWTFVKNRFFIHKGKSDE